MDEGAVTIPSRASFGVIILKKNFARQAVNSKCTVRAQVFHRESRQLSAIACRRRSNGSYGAKAAS
jgi:hypothetical protein